MHDDLQPQRRARLAAGTLVAACLTLPVAGGAAAQTERRNEPIILGAPAAFAPVDPREEIALEPGTPLFQSPARRAPTIALLDAAMTVGVLERRGAWARVRFGERVGWILLEQRLAGGASPTPLESLPPALRAASVDGERLVAARRGLGAHQAVAVGGYGLYTDISSARAGRLAMVLAHIDAAVEQRLGLAPPPAVDEAVVVFARAAGYRAFVESDDLTRGHAAHLGRAVDGLAAMSGEGLSVEQLETLLVHEVGHLVSRRLLGLALPPWLEEGIAEDLAYHRRDQAGALIAGSLAPSSEVRIAEASDSAGRLIFITRQLGGDGGLEALRRGLAGGRPLGLERFVAMTAAEFYASHDPDRYPRAGFFVRFLLETQRQPFQRFLAALAQGEAADAALLTAELAAGWPQLDAALSRWLLIGAGP